MDPYIILAKTEQGAWIETKEIGTSHWSKQEQLILAQGEDSKKGQLIYLTWKGSFQVILHKMIRLLSEILKKHTKLAKIVKISEIFNWLVFSLNFNQFCLSMTVICILNFYWHQLKSLGIESPEMKTLISYFNFGELQ